MSRVAYRLSSDFAARVAARPLAQSQTIFVGMLEDASLVARQLNSATNDLPPLGAIFASDCDEVHKHLANVPVLPLRHLPQSSRWPAGIAAPSSVTAVVGRSGFEDGTTRLEIVKWLRASDMRVLEYVGLHKPAASLADAPQAPFTDIDVASLMQRGAREIDADYLARAVQGKRVLITGGAGSIGRHLTERCLALGATQVAAVDRWEAGVFALSSDLASRFGAQFRGHVADIGDSAAMQRLFRTERPQIVFHAAAMKHVPIAEQNWVSAVKCNMISTLELALMAREHGVAQFVFVSTDKAVDPTTFMGWTKRFGELVCAHLAQSTRSADKTTRFLAVRFGNVIASAGSVVEVFNAQIRDGRAVTVTDPRMKRYFMTGREASDLVILAAARDADRSDASSGIFALEMGEQVSILDLAHSLIKLAGKEPNVDVSIDFVGIRANEKLEERLVSASEHVVASTDDGVLEIAAPRVSDAMFKSALDELQRIAASGSRDDVIALVQSLENPVDDGSNIVPLAGIQANRRNAAGIAAAE